MRRIFALLVLVCVFGDGLQAQTRTPRPGSGQQQKKPASKVPRGSGRVDWGPVTPVDKATTSQVMSSAKMKTTLGCLFSSLLAGQQK